MTGTTFNPNDSTRRDELNAVLAKAVHTWMHEHHADTGEMATLLLAAAAGMLEVAHGPVEAGMQLHTHAVLMAERARQQLKDEGQRH